LIFTRPPENSYSTPYLPQTPIDKGMQAVESGKSLLDLTEGEQLSMVDAVKLLIF